jgi:hypothetical protein
VELAAAEGLSSAAKVSFNSFLLTLKVPPYELTFFPNGGR